jgi:hypothetical protein
MRIKAEVFPYEDVDIEALLRDLASKRNGNKQPEFLIRYSRPEGKFIQIVNFQKHQNPHVNEKPSTLPAPEPSDTSTVQVQKKHSTTRASSLTPSSLTPSSLTDDSRESKDSPAAGARRAPEIVYPDDFTAFWKAYPRKIDKGEAFKAWDKIRPPRPAVETLLASVASLMRTRQWLDKNGQYIPNPATWLNRRGWESEVSSDDFSRSQSGLALPPLKGV